MDWAADRIRNRDGEIQHGAGRGLKFNPGRANAGYLLGTSEPQVQGAFAELIRPEMTVYDIGANVGFFSVIAARLVGPAGHVVSFEPLANNADRITHNARLNNFAHVDVRLEALGNENGSVGFFSSDVPTLGRLAKLGAPDESCAEVFVTVRRLDELVEQAGLPLPDLVKMDVEGGEVDVLLGARETLAISRPILLVELHGTNESVASVLEEQGYLIHVLGSLAAIRDAAWNSHIVAVPRERVELFEIASALCGSAPANEPSLSGL
jgi:FkbM family methyltransferase